MELSNTKLEMPKWVCALAIALGSVALAVQCAVDIYQGVSSGMDPGAKAAQVWQMSLPTGFTLVFAAMSGCLWRAGGWKKMVAGVGLFLLVVGYMTYTALNSMDFLADQTVARTQAQMSRQTQAKDIAEIRNKLALDARKEMSDNLWRTYTTAKNATERDKALAQIREASGETLAISGPEVEVVAVGVGATANKYWGWRPEAIQEAKAVAYPILVMIGKMLGITLGFAFYPSTAAEAWRAGAPTRLSADDFQEITWKVSKEEARVDILSMIRAGASIQSGRELSKRWRVREGTVSKWLADFRKEGLIKREANGNSRAVIAAPHISGNGRVLGNA